MSVTEQGEVEEYDARAGEITVICGGDVVLADHVATSCDVLIQDGHILSVAPSRNWSQRAGLRLVPAAGRLLAPGFIDMHSDYIESVASPRPNVILDLQAALYAADRELAMHGITTIYHSLSVYQMLIFDHKPIRSFANVRRLVELIGQMRAREGHGQLIRHRVHLRVEVDSVARLDEIADLLDSGAVDLLSFMDHTPGQGQYRDLGVFSKTLLGYRQDMQANDVRALVATQQEAPKLRPADMQRLCRLARERGITVASHDDDSTRKVELMQSIGVSVAEFPISLDVARHAQERGIHCLLGAPNVLLGYSHSGNLSARAAVCAGAGDILCSDYCPGALLSAAFTLRDHCGLGLAASFALMTRNPARALGVLEETGEIAVGKRADLLVIGSRVEPETEQSIPVVERVFVQGHPVFAVDYPLPPTQPRRVLPGNAQRQPQQPELARLSSARVP